MKKIFLSFLITASWFTPAFATVWAELPDVEFHTHPLVEISRSERQFARGKIEEVLRPATHSESGIIRVLVVSGPYTKKSVYARNFLRPPPSLIRERRGESVLISYYDKEGPEDVLIEDTDRTGSLLILALIFIGLVLVICGKKGIKSLLALALSVLTVRFVFIPAVAAGYCPVSWAVFSSLIMVVATMAAVGGAGIKSRAAVFGSLGGIAAALGLCAFFFRLSGLTGFFMEEIQLFSYISGGKHSIEFFSKFLMAIVILGASGVIMDAAISVSSSLCELKSKHPLLSRRRLYESGRAVGGDVSSTMVNTLIMAYLGGMLGVILVKNLRVTSLTQLFNLPFFHFEVYRALLGAAGFSVAIWLTVWSAARLASRKEKQLP